MDKRKNVYATRTLENGDEIRVIEGVILGAPTYFIEAKEAHKYPRFRAIGRRDNVKEAIAEMDRRIAEGF